MPLLWGSQSWLPPAFQPAPGHAGKRVRKQDCPTAIFEEGGTDHRLSWSVMPCPTTVGDRRQKAIVCPTSLLHGKLEIHLQHQRVAGHADVRYRELAGFAFVPGLRRSLFEHLPRLRFQRVLEV